MKLGERIHGVLAAGGLTPRHLGGATKVHFVTIYRIMGNADANIYPSTKNTLALALSKIEQMIEAGTLPLTEKLSRKEKTERLTALLAPKDQD